MGLNVLIVDDDASFASLLRIRLESWRSDAILNFVRTIGDARSFLSSSEVDLILLDQHLPDGNGSELLDGDVATSAAIVALSSDTEPEVMGHAVRAGAAHFLMKTQVSAPLFLTLLDAVIQRKAFEKQLRAAELRSERLETIRVLLATLQHEINNPLGAVLGAAYLLRTAGNLAPEQTQALELIESSSERIGHVVRELCRAAEVQELEAVMKAHEKVFQVPGDPAWGETKPKK